MSNVAESNVGVFSFFVIILILWVLPWKGYALWTAVKRGEKWWFIALLLINTLAILEIIYIFFVAKKKEDLRKFVKKILNLKS
ncbi:MAG: hypothetical protein HYT29_00985 [Parcubacteria group bacterium]|nr:hypothetical protein [Parcubacteria group bacterium]